MGWLMEPMPRHQCLIYDGPPSRHLKALAAVTRDKLQQNRRCLYLNSIPMVAGMRSYLAATGVDVEQAIRRGNLVLVSEQQHLVNGRFDAGHMMLMLEQALAGALRDGYAGLWATGDMTWEMGPDTDFLKLVGYEWRLEKFFEGHPELGGICQYHADTLPREIVRQGLIVHPSIFVNETLSLINPHHVHTDKFTPDLEKDSEIDGALTQLLQPQASD